MFLLDKCHSSKLRTSKKKKTKVTVATAAMEEEMCGATFKVLNIYRTFLVLLKNSIFIRSKLPYYMQIFLLVFFLKKKSINSLNCLFIVRGFRDQTCKQQLNRMRSALAVGTPVDVQVIRNNIILLLLFMDHEVVKNSRYMGWFLLKLARSLPITRTLPLLWLLHQPSCTLRSCLHLMLFVSFSMISRLVSFSMGSPSCSIPFLSCSLSSHEDF